MAARVVMDRELQITHLHRRVRPIGVSLPPVSLVAGVGVSGAEL